MTALIEWGWMGRALAEESGDLHVVVESPAGVVVALIDGLGHGSDAAVAARAAASVIVAAAAQPVLELFRRCHAALRATRGVAMSLASFSRTDASMTWAGVGNVEGVLVRAGGTSGHVTIPQRGGIVGYQLVLPHAETTRVEPGDILVLASDGIAEGFVASVTMGAPPQTIACGLLEGFAKKTDDAHVVVARYRGATT